MIGSLNGVCMFANNQDVSLLNTVTDDAKVVWKVFNERYGSFISIFYFYHSDLTSNPVRLLHWCIFNVPFQKISILLSSGNSSFVSYFLLKFLAFETPSPLESPMTLF